jgi:hypothetical protein
MMGVYYKTTAEIRQEIIARYKNGESVRSIATKFRIDRSYVYILAQKAGCRRNKRFQKSTFHIACRVAADQVKSRPLGWGRPNPPFRRTKGSGPVGLQGFRLGQPHQSLV